MPSIGQLAADWMVAHVESRWKPKPAKSYRSLIKGQIVPHLGAIRTDQLTEAQVSRMHAAGKLAPYAANRAVAVLSKMMSWAERQGFRPRGSNPCKGLDRYREHKRERFLSIEEIERLGAALANEEAVGTNPFAIAALRLLILTGARLSEILTLRWSDVDLGRGLLLLSDSKTGRKALHLSAPAAAILASVRRVDSNPHVIVGSIEGEHLTDLKKPWRRVQQTSGLKGVRLHDLRHSFASVALAQGGSLSIIGKTTWPFQRQGGVDVGNSISRYQRWKF